MENENELEKLLDKVDLEHMLEFETQIFLDIIHKDGLVVAAKGISLDLVITNLLRVYCDPGNLVIVLNATEQDEKLFTTKLQNENVHVTTCTSTVTERQDIYLSGGINFVTTRILVVDMLKKRLPIEKITGLVVLKAHSIFESCQEAFVLRLFRQHNKTGFVKAFTNNVHSFLVGFGHVERVMRALFVKELYIWPRFHSIVVESLKKFEPQVIEIHVPISDNVKKIQTHILDLMNLTVKELKRVNKTVELQEISVENCLVKKFHKILQNQLDGIWHQLSTKSRQLIADLKTLRHLIVSLLYTDPVTFYSILSSYRTKEYAQISTWVIQEPAELLFKQVSSLVYSGDKELNPEFCPKWEPLLDILKVEIPNEIKQIKSVENKILVLCSDHKTCHQLQQLLTQGPNLTLFLIALKRKISFKKLHKSFANFKKPDDIEEVNSTKNNAAKRLKSDSNNKKGENNVEEEENFEEENYKDSYLLTMTQSQIFDNNETINGKIEQHNQSQVVFESFPEMENMDLTQLCEASTAPTILIQTFKAGSNCLTELKPNFIILYHCNITAIREIEMYEGHRNRETGLKVYLLIHSGTAEEQSYLTSLRREKEAFEYLISTKSSMVVPEDQDGKSGECIALQRESTSPTKNTRQGGKTDEEPTKSVIIVDIREFRSELPTLIHKRGIEIEPVTITIGDYILTPNICVERKSISDLIGSLNTGRLYQQCMQMTRFYTHPMLLIEFDKNKPFSWQNHYMVSTDCDNFDIQKKLLLLTLHFPKLKIIWSPSPYASAQLFEELKQGKEEPDIKYASSLGAEQDVDTLETKYNSDIYDFVQKLPGITTKNIDSFLRNTGSLDDALKKNRDELKEVLGNSLDANSFHSALHEEHAPKDADTVNKQIGKFKKFIKPKKK